MKTAPVQVKHDTVPTPEDKPTPIHRQPAAEKLSAFLKEEHIVLIPTVMTEQCTIAGGGIILNDKPLIKIQVEYKTPINEESYAV